MQIRCNFLDISYLSETQKNNFQFSMKNQYMVAIWRFAWELPQRGNAHGRTHFREYAHTVQSNSH